MRILMPKVKKFKRKDTNRPTYVVNEFGDLRDSRGGIPHDAVDTTKSSYTVNYKSYGMGKDDVQCPNCGRVNQMDHGDRILCGCDTMIETFGNRLVYWDQKLAMKRLPPYKKLTQDDLRKPIIELLTASPDIRALYEDVPAIRDAMDELEVLIKLHENVDLEA